MGGTIPCELGGYLPPACHNVRVKRALSIPFSESVTNVSCILCICNKPRSTRGEFNLKRVETCTVCPPPHHLASGDIVYKFSMLTAYSEGEKVSNSVKILGSSHSIFKGLQYNPDLLRSSEDTTLFIGYW